MSNLNWPLLGIVVVAFAFGYAVVHWFFNQLPKPPPAARLPGEGRPGAAPETVPPPSEEARHAAVLGLAGEITPAEVKRAYRELLTKYHPDKVSHLGAEFHRLAEERTREIIAAYAYFKNKYHFD